MTIEGYTSKEIEISDSSPPTTRRFVRSSQERVLAGVAHALAAHLRLPPVYVRVAFVLLAAFKGFGALLYVAYWAVVPQEPGDGPAGRRWSGGRLVALCLFLAGLLLALQSVRPIVRSPLLFAALLAGGGVALIWWQADETQRERLLEIAGRSGPAGRFASRPVALVRVGAGAVLVVAGLATFLFGAADLAATRDAVVATAVVVLGVVLITGPWWWRLVEMLAAERRERIRSQERADLAAHLHDSVLHTLALIQRHADSPREIVRLARGQERELRTWLYRSERAGAADRFAAALEAAAAEVEDTYAVTVETVVVGDVAMSERLTALVRAAREALVNAARHAGVPEVSLYAEVEPTTVSVYVRDRGRGFDPDAVPADRHGVTGSIVGRMLRHGGTAVVRSSPGAGTEVELAMRLDG